MTYTTKQLEQFADNLDEAVFRLTGRRNTMIEATAFRAVTAELIAARRKLDAVTAERDEVQTDMAKVIMSLPTGKGERAAGAVDGVKMMRARLEAKLDAVQGLVECGQDVIRASNTLMLMLAGDIAMTKPSLEAAIRRALDARNQWDNALAAWEAP